MLFSKKNKSANKPGVRLKATAGFKKTSSLAGKKKSINNQVGH